MAKAPSEWCSEDHLDVLEERGQRTEDQRTQEVESALCYELCANNGVTVTPGREVGECSPSPYSHLELTPQPLKPLYSVIQQVSLIPPNSQASLHFLMDQPPLITGAGVGGKSHRNGTTGPFLQSSKRSRRQLGSHKLCLCQGLCQRRQQHVPHLAGSPVSVRITHIPGLA